METAKQRPENSLGMQFEFLDEAQVRLAVWPVRVQDFRLFVEETGHDASTGMFTLGPDDIDWSDKGHTWDNPGFEQGPDHPVVGVSYEDAQAFCKWLTEYERKRHWIGGSEFFCLPADEQWSEAIGLKKEVGTTPEARLYHQKGGYPWGPAWPPPPLFGNYAGEESREGMPSWWGVVPGGYRDPFPRTSSSGKLCAKPPGLYDLSGNVWEWCEDPFARAVCPRVVRGGSWGSDRPPISYPRSGTLS